MASQPDHETLIDAEGGQKRGYAAWKCAKIERALVQSRDRDAMVPIEQIWHDLKLEG